MMPMPLPFRLASNNSAVLPVRASGALLPICAASSKGQPLLPLAALGTLLPPRAPLPPTPQRLDQIVIATMGKIYQGNVSEQRQPHMLPTFMRKFHEHIKVQPPHPIDDITPAQLKALIKAMPDDTPGLDGIAKADLLLLLLFDEALDWFALFFQELERGMAWPTCSNIARTAFLSKWG